MISFNQNKIISLFFSCTGRTDGLVSLTRDFPRNFHSTSKIEQIYCTVDGMLKQINETFVFFPPRFFFEVSKCLSLINALL